MFISGQFDKPHIATGEIDTPEQRALARRASTESIVLLKNFWRLTPSQSVQGPLCRCHGAECRGSQNWWRRQFAGHPKIFHQLR